MTSATKNVKSGATAWTPTNANDVRMWKEDQIAFENVPLRNLKTMESVFLVILVVYTVAQDRTISWVKEAVQNVPNMV